ncbi:MAG: SGNH/GDSL hydrolase family protein [Candidatus Promineifilaceae bacterium]
MKKRCLALLFLILFLLTGCAQTTQAGSNEVVSAERTSPTAVPVLFVLPTPMQPTVNPSPQVESATPTVTPVAPPPTLTAVSTSTVQPPTPTATATLYPVPDSVLVNGLSPDSFIYLPPGAIRNSQNILAHGMMAGRDTHRFSKIGDSIVDTEQFFVPFETGSYQLGDYQYLQEAVRYYAGSFDRFGFALRSGLNSTAVMDPMWANKEHCLPNETALACEIRANNPSFLLIHFGTNDWTPTFDRNMRQILNEAIGKGIVPVLITKANRVDGTNERNDILRAIAAEYELPLWDFDVVAGTLPDRGLDEDEAHLTISTEFDYSLSGKIYSGYKAFNLSGLIFLDTFMREVVLPISENVG